MPYSKNSELPDRVKNNLPEHAQDIYREAYNHASKEYEDSDKRRNPDESSEAVAHKVAWSAVENKYHKQGDEWVEN